MEILATFMIILIRNEWA